MIRAVYIRVVALKLDKNFVRIDNRSNAYCV